jgi:hypothetical protein
LVVRRATFAHLDVGLGFAGKEFEGRLWDWHGPTKSRARYRLTIRAVTDVNLVRANFGLIRDGAAVTPTVDLHGPSPTRVFHSYWNRTSRSPEHRQAPIEARAAAEGKRANSARAKEKPRRGWRTDGALAATCRCGAPRLEAIQCTDRGDLVLSASQQRFKLQRVHVQEENAPPVEGGARISWERVLVNGALTGLV